MPAGYGRPRGALRKKTESLNATAVFALRRIDAPQAFRGSVAVIPMKIETKKHEAELRQLEDPVRHCDLMRKTAPAGTQTKLIQMRHGQVCQVTGKGPDHPYRRFDMITIKEPGVMRGWVVTCNRDERDPGAVRACRRVLDGWRFEK